MPESATEPGRATGAPGQVALFLVATQFLTRVPVPSAGGFQARWLGESLRFFPLVGGLVGLASVTVWWLASHWFPRPIAAGLMLAAALLITGAFHEDGFADACDGLGGGNSRERALAIMKDSRIGAFGAVGLIVLIGLKWSALIALPSAAFWVIVVAAHVVSRWCSIGLIWALQYARAEGAGKSREFDGGLSGAQWLLSAVIGMTTVAIPLIWRGVAMRNAIATAAVAGFGAAAITAFVAAVYFKRRIGGYTGDCLGAVQQTCELMFLLGALAFLRAALPGATP